MKPDDTELKFLKSTHRGDDSDFSHEIPLNFLRKGTRFIAVRDAVHAPQYRSGVATMDGHNVSDNYGARTGNTYYSGNPEEDYINVQWDSKSYTLRTHNNDTLYLREGWRILVSLATKSQYLTDKKFLEQSAEDQQREKDLQTIKEEIARAQADLHSAQLRLAKLHANS